MQSRNSFFFAMCERVFKIKGSDSLYTVRVFNFAASCNTSAALPRDAYAAQGGAGAFSLKSAGCSKHMVRATSDRVRATISRARGGVSGVSGGQTRDTRWPKPLCGWRAYMYVCMYTCACMCSSPPFPSLYMYSHERQLDGQRNHLRTRATNFCANMQPRNYFFCKVCEGCSKNQGHVCKVREGCSI